LCVLSVAPALAAEPGAAEVPKVVTKGGVRFYPKEKRIEMDGRFCLAEGPLDLLACAAGGKEYESVIALDVTPQYLHFCLLLMGLKPGDTGVKVHNDAENLPTGSPVTVKVRWKDESGEKIVRGEDLCWNAIDKRTIPRTPWVFVGSKKVKDPDTGKEVYWADVDKSLMTVIRDPLTVLDLPLALGVNYGDYVVNKQLVPKVGTPCTVILEPAPPLPQPPMNAAGGRIHSIDVTLGDRTLVDAVQPPDLVELLKRITRDAPKDTCAVTIDHGAAAKTAAVTFEALDAAGARIDSVQTVRARADVSDAATVLLRGDKLAMPGANTPELSADQVKANIRQVFSRSQDRGVAVKVEAGASLKALATALHALEEFNGAVLRVVWLDNKPVAK
jgi:hypothetical protein